MKKLLLIVSLAVLIPFTKLISEDTKVDYVPKITMLLRTKAEQNLSTQYMNFMVRNARFGLKGKITNQLSYEIEVDWQDKEDMDMQDAKIIYTPIENFEFILGQFKSPYGNDYLRNPADYSFANRTFITKRLQKNMRDVGAMVAYTLPFERVPIKLEFGIFNGNTSNSFEHDLTKAAAGKISISPFKNSNLQFSGYKGEVTLDKDKKIFTNAEMVDVSYSHKIGGLFLDVEAAQKKYLDSTNAKFWSVFGIVAYDFPIENFPIIKITPAVRYEIYDKDPDSKDESPRRISAGLTFHLKEGNNSYFRLDYEKYTYKSGFASQSDMITLEYVIRI